VNTKLKQSLQRMGGVLLAASCLLAACAPAAPAATATPNVQQSIGAGEGQVDIVAWVSYIERGDNDKNYDWVTGFEKDTGCKVNVKIAGTSDEMVTLMNQGGYDLVTASGDASLRLVYGGTVQPINLALIKDWGRVDPRLQNGAWHTVNGVHYGVPYQWGSNVLMYNKTAFGSTPPTSWNVLFEEMTLPDGKSNKGRVQAYAGPIYIADAALYLKAHNSSLGITDPYELTSDQLDAAVTLLKQQRTVIGKYWSVYTDEIDNFKNGATVVGTTWPYQVNALKGLTPPVPVEAIVPSEGMTGWADTWMMSAKAQHPNCMLKWMAWMITPEVQAQVAENFGESPANPKACKYLDPGYGPYALKNFCTLYSVNDPSYYGQIAFWKTPLPECGDSRGQTCTDYSTWTQKWTEIKG